MIEILILGALPQNDSESDLYNTLVRVCNKYAQKVFSPIDTAKFRGTEQQLYDRALLRVREADLIIGEQSKPSTGQGIEIGYAIQLQKPILVVTQQGSKVSGLVKGCPLVKNISYYNSQRDLEAKLSENLEQL